MRPAVEDGQKLWRCAVTCELAPPANAPQLLSPSSPQPLTFIVISSRPFFQLLTSPAGAHSSDLPTMTDKLPPMLLNLFAPRPPLRWVEPSDHAPEKRCTPKISGVGQYLQALREYKDSDGYVPTDSWLQKRDRKKLEKKEKQEKLLSEGIHQCTSTPPLPHHSLTLTPHRQAQRRPQSAGRRLQDPLRLAPRLRRHLGRP
jgi:hypothetical protein